MSISRDKGFLSPGETVDAVIEAGCKKCSLSILRMFLLGIFAGMFIAFGGFASSMVSHTMQNTGLSKFMGAAVFPVGLMLVVICGAELFTGNNLITLSVLDNRVTFSCMLKNWFFVYIGNFVGSVIIAVLILGSGLLNTSGGALGGFFIKVAYSKVSLTFSQALIRGILCNILVVLAVCMAVASRDIVSKIWSCWFPIMLFVLSGFEHSIANMFFIPVGILSKGNEGLAWAAEIIGISAQKLSQLTWGSFVLNNLIPVTVGNIIGGAVVVPLVYWYVYRKNTPFKEDTSLKV